MNQMYAKKVGMTQIFDSDGNIVPVTVLEAGVHTVVQKKTKESDGYEALQIGITPIPEKKTNEPQRGHFKKAGTKPFQILREIKMDTMGEIKSGQELSLDHLFKVGDFVDVSATSKGKGFQGTMKRHNFGGGPKSHGSMSHRRPAAAGETQNARVYRGKRSPGHMGSERVTVQGLEVLLVQPENQLLAVKGSVPGPGGSLVFLRTSVKSAKKIRRKETAKLAKQQQEAPAKEKGKAKKQ